MKNAPRRRAPIGPFFDYDQAALLTGYKPSYVKRLCDTGRLGYIVLHYYRGHYRRNVRKIPDAEIERLMLERYGAWS